MDEAGSIAATIGKPPELLAENMMVSGIKRGRRTALVIFGASCEPSLPLRQLCSGRRKPLSVAH
jgi:hypothetical protein